MRRRVERNRRSAQFHSDNENKRGKNNETSKNSSNQQDDFRRSSPSAFSTGSNQIATSEEKSLGYIRGHLES